MMKIFLNLKVTNAIFFILAFAAGVLALPQAEAQQSLAKVNVATTIPFVAFGANVGVNLDSNGNLVSLHVSGNIPTMTTQNVPLQNFSNGTQYTFKGAQGPALGIKFDSNFTTTEGGPVTLFALDCSGQTQQQELNMRRVSANQWALEDGTQQIKQINLTANVNLGAQWTGCFDDVNLSGE